MEHRQDDQRHQREAGDRFDLLRAHPLEHGVRLGTEGQHQGDDGGGGQRLAHLSFGGDEPQREGDDADQGGGYGQAALAGKFGAIAEDQARQDSEADDRGQHLRQVARHAPGEAEQTEGAQPADPPAIGNIALPPAALDPDQQTDREGCRQGPQQLDVQRDHALGPATEGNETVRQAPPVPRQRLRGGCAVHCILFDRPESSLRQCEYID